MKCKNYTSECDNANICPCLSYEECDNYCRSSCKQNVTIEDDERLYHYYCKLNCCLPNYLRGVIYGVINI